MFAIKKRALGTSDEKLTSVRVLATVRHRQQPGRVVFEREILVRKRTRAVDADHAGAVAVHKISALDHEILDDSVENRALVSGRYSAVPPVLAGAELSEVLRSFGTNILEQFENHSANLVRANGHVEKHHRVVRVSQLRLNLIPRWHLAKFVIVFLAPNVVVLKQFRF